MIDREGPRQRPAGPIRGYQQWRHLLFMHWPVPVDVLRPLVPAALELDLFDRTAYVGVVPFAMQGVRPRWWPKFCGFRFLETNVRTYVCHQGRPGVYFFSLDAASRLAVWAARRYWGLPYYHATMHLKACGDEIHYSSRRTAADEATHTVRYRIGEPLGPSEPGTIEFFFLERYLLFLEHQQAIFSGQVYHSPYPAQTVEISEVEDELMAAAGLGSMDQMPEFAHYVAGVDVEVFDLKRFPAQA